VSGVRFSQQIFDVLCERLADGESLRAICSDKNMPSTNSVMKWLAKNEELAQQYARARESQADAIFDEILDIADDARNDWMKVNGKDDEGYQLNGEAVRRSQIRIDARKWMAGKLRPKKYGEKYVTELTGPGGGPVELVARRAIPDDIDEARLKSIEAALRLAITPPREEIDNDEKK
jgi:hypothetical protein